jgi:threonine aldolase
MKYDLFFQLAVRAKKLNIPLHMDGARLFNAAVYLKVPASRIVRDFASATFCISKGLGAPVGAILAGDKEFIRKQVSVHFSC